MAAILAVIFLVYALSHCFSSILSIRRCSSTRSGHICRSTFYVQPLLLPLCGTDYFEAAANAIYSVRNTISEIHVGSGSIASAIVRINLFKDFPQFFLCDKSEHFYLLFVALFRSERAKIITPCCDGSESFTLAVVSVDLCMSLPKLAVFAPHHFHSIHCWNFL
jgi:hypothetical protein